MSKEYLPIVAPQPEDVLIKSIDTTFPGANTPIPKEMDVATALFLAGAPIDVIVRVYMPEFIKWRDRNARQSVKGQQTEGTSRTQIHLGTQGAMRRSSDRPPYSEGIPMLNIHLGARCEPKNRIYGGDEYAPTTRHCSVEPELPM
jgi:hypothetical protein